MTAFSNDTTKLNEERTFHLTCDVAGCDKLPTKRHPLWFARRVCERHFDVLVKSLIYGDLAEQQREMEQDYQATRFPPVELPMYFGPDKLPSSLFDDGSTLLGED